MTDKQINKWLRRQMSPTGWVLVVYYALVNLLSVLAMLWEALRQLKRVIGKGPNWMAAMDLDAIASNAWGYIVAIGVGVVLFYAWKGPGYWRNVMLVKHRAMDAGTFFTVLCMCVGSQMVNSLWISGLEAVYSRFDKSLMPLLESVSGDSDTFSMFLYAAILAPIAEELLFRGYILQTLRPYGKKFAVFGSAFLFGLFHGNLLQTPYAFLMGLLLGYVAVEYSPCWSVVLHMFNNLVLADLLTRLTALLPVGVANILTLTLLGGCMAASGVILAVRRREITAYLAAEWMDRRVLKCFFTNVGILVLTVVMLGNILMLLP